MKHCPNPECPFLREYKMVAEFSDEVEFCRDCGTQLVAGEAPAYEEAPAVADQPAALENRTLDLVALCTLDSEADADFYKAKLEFQGIPIAIVHEATAADDSPETPLFELQVLRSDLMRATYLLDTLAGSETENIELDDEDYYENLADEEDEDPLDHKANPQWADPDIDDEAESALPTIHRAKDASPVREPTNVSVPAMQPDAADGIAKGRFSPILLIVIGVIVVLVLWFLINRFVLS